MQARDVMTRQVVTVGPETSVGYAAEVMAGHGFPALPVVDDEDRLVGIVSRRDLLRALVRPDEEIRHDLLRLVEGYTGALDSWEVRVTDGLATIRRTRGLPEPTAEVEQQALSALARTVGGVVGVRVLSAGDAGPVDETRALPTHGRRWP